MKSKSNNINIIYQIRKETSKYKNHTPHQYRDGPRGGWWGKSLPPMRIMVEF